MKPQQTSPKQLSKFAFLAGYSVLLGVSFILGFEPGKRVAQSFFTFAGTMLAMMPVVFVLIGLFEVWVARETVERHLGTRSGFLGYFWAILLGGTVLGPLYVALPVACVLFQKGARLGLVFTYLGAAAICRVPMTAFEATFLGVKFTIVRFLVSLPLVILTSIILEKYLVAEGYAITEPEH